MNRSDEALRRNEPWDSILSHAQAAEQHYCQALALCPPVAIDNLGRIYGNLGQLYFLVGQTEMAREHYERSLQYFEQTDNRYDAGQTRYNLAHMYCILADLDPARRGDLLHRSLAYAHASLRDFQHYQGRTAADEADAQRLIDHIAQALGA